MAMKIAVFDPVGNWGGGSRVVRALLPAIKRNLPDSKIVYFGNLTTIEREGFAPEFNLAGINTEELISTRLSKKGLWGIHKSDMVFRLVQQKNERLQKILPLYLSGDVTREFDLAFFPWIFLVSCPDLRVPSVAPMTIEEPIDSEVFKTYVSEILCPTLNNGDMIIMDNLPTHKVPGVVELTEGAGAEVVYLPPYSPDFNPIEKMWSKIKSVLRKIKARSKIELNEAFSVAFDDVTPSDAHGWFKSCGYVLIHS